MAAALIRRIVDLHRRQLRGVVEVRGVGRMRGLYDEARADLERSLADLRRRGRSATFGAQHMRLVLSQVADAIGGFERGLDRHLALTGRQAAVLAPRHLVDTVSRMEAEFGRMTPVIQARQAAVVTGVVPGVMPSLLDRYRSSVRLYGRPTIAAIREGMARSMVRGEDVDESIGRVVEAGGLFDGQKWRAERIVRTELSYSYGVTKQGSMQALKTEVPRLQKRLVATIDDRTGEDSLDLNGQTVDVDQPFVWEVRDSRGRKTGKVVRYMQPPNRPNDREVVIPWLASWEGARSLGPAGGP